MSKQIIIIGAGISGLVAGILLRQQGFEVTIYEKRSCIEPIGGGLGIWPNGVRVLMNLPCAEKIALLPAPITHDLFSDEKGNTLTEVPRALFLQINGYPIMNVCRSELHQILVNEFGIEHIAFNQKCIAIQQDDSKVIAGFESHQAEADLLIGADGAYSTVRKILFPTTQLIYSGYLHFLGVLQYPSLAPQRHHFIFGKNRYCLQFPISQARHMFYQVIPYAQGTISQLTTRQERTSLFRGWSDEVDNLLNAYEQSLLRPEFQHHFYCEESYTMPVMHQWHDRHVVLIGDAAHPMGSIMGLAAGCGLEDSDVLATNLKTKPFSEAIVGYEEKQIPRITKLYQLEKSMTDFILDANLNEYHHIIAELKNKTPLEANQELINSLQ